MCSHLLFENRELIILQPYSINSIFVSPNHRDIFLLSFVFSSLFSFLCFCFFVFVSLFLFLCFCFFVFVSLFLFLCFCFVVFVSLFLFLCFCFFVFVSLFLFLCFIFFVFVSLFLFLCFCFFVFVSLFYLCFCFFVFISLFLFLCFCFFIFTCTGKSYLRFPNIIMVQYIILKSTRAWNQPFYCSIASPMNLMSNKTIINKDKQHRRD